jgi:hypothetical protein
MIKMKKYHANSITEFKEMLSIVPSETIMYHGKEEIIFQHENYGRGEIQIAEHLQPLKVSDFKDPKR